MPIEDGKFVKVEYTGTLDDGEVFDSTDNHGFPLEFQVGQGQIIPGFENGVKEMELNKEKEIKILPDDAYGNYNDKLIVDFPKEKIPRKDIEAGQMLLVSTDDGKMARGTVIEVGEKDVKIDCNHPLAGKTLNFKIKVVSISDEGTQGCQTCGSCNACG